MKRRIHTQLRAAHGYLAMPVVLTRGGLYAAVIALGFLASAGIVVGVLSVRGVANERSDRSAAARAALKRELELKIDATRRADELGRRTRRLERPSSRDLRRIVTRELRLIHQHPSILRGAGFAAPGVSAAPAPAPARPPGSPARPPRSPSSRRPASPAPPADTGHPPASGSPPSSTSPPRPSPPVTVTIPPGLPIPCSGITTPLIDVDCP